MRKFVWRIALILLVVGTAIYIDQPKINGSYLGSLNKSIELRRGLDLAGGVHLVYELDLSKLEAKDRADATQGVIQTIDRRINALGVSEPTIQEGKVGESRTVIVELPGVTNTQDAINLIGRTAQLEFYEQSDDPNLVTDLPGFKPTGLTGAHLTSADTAFQDPQQVGSGRNSLAISEPIVQINFNDEGRKMFAEITKRNLGKPLAIVIDKQMISAPTVQSVIDQGVATISGGFDVKAAKELSISLSSGALPVPIRLIEEQTVGATLGNESIEKSIVAGLIGVILVMLFMILYYGIKGVFASIALVLYVIIVFAFFKLIPVTLTLSGIAGLILSIGAAVDANILIFERMKEEERLGKNVANSIDDGFKRAWSSIRDSNAASLIISMILLWFGTGLVKGFAVTLMIGILVSLFSAITISQTLLKLFLRKSKAGRV